MPATSCPRRAPGAPALGVLLAALVLLAAPIGAQPTTPPVVDPATIAGPPPAPQSGAREVPRLAVELFESVMSPFCPGLLLSNCPSPSADSLRSAIVERVERGDTRAQIEAELYEIYGETVRAAPRASGFGLVAWLAPAVVLLGGGLWIAVWLRRASTRRPTRPTRSTAASPHPAPTLVAGDAARVEELARLDRLVRDEGAR